MSETDGLKKFLSEIEDGACNVLSVVKKTLPGGDGISTVKLERKRAMPERMESPKRAHIFHDADGFVKYLGRFQNENMRVFANLETCQIDCVLDESAKDGFEVVTLIPMEHPQFTLLDSTLIKPAVLTMKRLALNVMRNRAVIVDTQQQSARDLAMIMQQITVSTKTKAHTGTGVHAINGFIVETNVKAGPVDELVELPDTIAVELPIYLNTEPKKFGIDITIGIEHNEPSAVIDCPELITKKLEVFQEIVAPIKKMDGVFVAAGQRQTGAWLYNR